MQPGSVTSIEVNKTLNTSDQIAVNGNITYGGTLAVANLAGTLEKAKAARVSVLDGPFSAGGRNSAMVQFPGGYIAEIHSPVPKK